MQKDKDSWFAEWFDTPYYHILYKDRDTDEAGYFMNRLTRFLDLPQGAEVLDLACGRGRHARYLHKLGFDVTGVDLSPSSIAYAKRFESEHLHFAVHDMCLPYPKTFDAVLNLFTSFGYFETETDNVRTIRSIKSELKPGGKGVIDFLNSNLVKDCLVPYEEKVVEGIRFRISKSIKDGYIIKTIAFTDDQEEYQFTERVKALGLQDFEDYFKSAGVTLEHCFGDYHLSDFNEQSSERLILIFS